MRILENTKCEKKPKIDKKNSLKKEQKNCLQLLCHFVASKYSAIEPLGLNMTQGGIEPPSPAMCLLN